MRPARAALTGLAAALTVAACAPDAVRRDRDFEAWLGEVRSACRTDRIGLYTIDGLLGSTGSREGNHFLNQTSRLYAGRITPEQWTSSVTSFVSGRASDAGVRCVLDRLPKSE
jgi:hypothetical protein